jgi:NADPH-dependent 2,4-dienoyl-CoA reductase/sulfur reductase-like enzyme/rhodanese-related sulfurtransferase
MSTPSTVIIVGGVAGGMSAATRLRRLDNELNIVVLERSGHVSYANCGLPYFVGGVIENEEDLLLQTPQSLHERFRLDVRVNHEVVDVNSHRRTVTVRHTLNDQTFELSYDHLVLSPGARAIVPPIPGIERALVLRNVEDVELMSARVALEPRSAVIIGGGIIGLEIAENLVRRGVLVTIVEASSQVMAPLDPEMAQLVANELESHGVQLRLGNSVSAIGPVSVDLSNGQVVAADLVVVAIGVRPETTLAQRAGAKIGPRGGISVDDFHRTSVPNVYAVGDAVEKLDALDGAATLVPLANVANREGRVVADHIAGRAVRTVRSQGTAIVKIFDLSVAVTGWNEKRLDAAGRASLCIHTHPWSHATYYPGSSSMSLKILVDPTTGEILGAQGVGTDGVDKRIDVIATAMRGGLDATQLADLELAYAPPFGSAKDPVNMLGYIAENLLSGLERTLQWSHLDEAIDDGATVVDVRSAEEFALGAIPTSVNIPIDSLRDRVNELCGRHVVTVCKVGLRGHSASMLLNELGVDAVNLDGGFQTWCHSPAARREQDLRPLATTTVL